MNVMLTKVNKLELFFSNKLILCLFYNFYQKIE